jgi:hypothetical protein
MNPFSPELKSQLNEMRKKRQELARLDKVRIENLSQSRLNNSSEGSNMYLNTVRNNNISFTNSSPPMNNNDRMKVLESKLPYNLELERHRREQIKKSSTLVNNRLPATQINQMAPALIKRNLSDESRSHTNDKKKVILNPISPKNQKGGNTSLPLISSNDNSTGSPKLSPLTSKNISLDIKGNAQTIDSSHQDYAGLNDVVLSRFCQRNEFIIK